jgi:hypothetical protein
VHVQGGGSGGGAALVGQSLSQLRVDFKGRAADLGPVINPLTVGLAIGDDMGAAVVTADSTASLKLEGKGEDVAGSRNRIHSNHPRFDELH